MMLRQLRKIVLGFLAIGVLAISVTMPLSPSSIRAQDNDVTYWPTLGWRTSTPEEQGMDSAKLVAMLDQIEQQATNVHSILVVRNGYVVLDVSTDPFDTSQPHAVNGVTKSIISTLTGIAVDQGYIQSVDQNIWDYFSADDTANMDADKQAITLEHLLTHDSGLSVASNTLLTLTADDQSWIQYVLDQPMANAPGEHAIESYGEPHLVSAIIQGSTGMSTSEYAQQALFDPLGITTATWQVDPQGVTFGANGMLLSAHDLAKIGYLYLRGGEWDGQQLVPSSWIETATSGLVEFQQYGYYWWVVEVGLTEKHAGYLALGENGESLLVIPDLDLIVVTTGYELGWGDLLASAFIIPAVQSDTALPPNEAAQAMLQAKVDEFGNPTLTDVPMPSEMQAQVDNQMYVLADNGLGWTSLTLSFSEQEALLTLEVEGNRLELPVGLDGVYRISEAGLPDDIINWRTVPNVPLALKGAWNRNRFVIDACDLIGSLDGEILLQFGDDGTLQIRPQAVGLPRISITGTPQ